MLRMENVSKTYQHRGQTVKALDSATVHIPRGDFVSVVGPSGSGKSTLLLMLGGMLSPSQGRVLLEEQVGLRPEPDRRAQGCAGRRSASSSRRSIWCPTSRPWKTCRFRSSWPRWTKKTQKDRATALLERVGLGRPARPQTVRVERRPAAAGGPGPNAGQRSGRHSRRRADRQSGPRDQPADHRFPGGVQRGRAHHRDGDARSPRAAERAKRVLRLESGSIVSQEVGKEAFRAA